MKEIIYLGIDVSKGYADFVLVNSSQQLLEPLFQLDDTTEGHHKLASILNSYVCIQAGIEILCGLESTGGYERNWYHYLLSLEEVLPLKVALLNPIGVKGISKASLNRTVTDDVSAMNIACYLISYQDKLHYGQGDPSEDTFKSGRSVYTYQKMLNKQKVQLSNQLEKLLYQSFSQVLVYCRDGIPVHLLKILSKYPTSEHIKKAGVTALSKIKGIGSVRAKRIFEKASQNSCAFNDNLAFVIQHTCLEILHKQEQIEQSKDYLKASYKDHDLVQLLCTIIGISYHSAIAILFEIEDINRFSSAKKIAAYFGVNPEFKQSGDGTWGQHMSKKGRKTMRAILYMVCLSAIKCDPLMKKKYAEIKAQGKDHYFAMGVLIHKMLRIIYGVLKSGKAYNALIDQQNRKKSLDKQADLKQLKKQQTKDNLKKKRRYQLQQLSESPISKRKVRKIIELETSQESNKTQ